MSKTNDEVAIALLKRELEDLKADVAQARQELDEIKAIANRWRGGAAALIALGSFAGFLVSQWTHIKAGLRALVG